MDLSDLPKRRASQKNHAYRRNRAVRSRPAERISRTPITINIPHALYDELEERAKYLGVFNNELCQDIIIFYLREAARLERARGITDLNPKVTLPERYPGYTHDLILKGDAPSHLDGSPLGLEELS